MSYNLLRRLSLILLQVSILTLPSWARAADALSEPSGTGTALIVVGGIALLTYSILLIRARSRD